MNKVESQSQHSTSAQCNCSPVDGLLCASQLVGLDAFLIAHRQNVGCTAGGFWRFAGSDDSFAGEISRTEISFVGAASSENARCWSCPCGELGFQSLHRERVLSQKTGDMNPRNSNSGEWVVDLDSTVAVDDLGCDDENPNHDRNGKAITQSDYGFSDVTSLPKREKDQGNNEIGNNQVNPTRFALKNVNILHDFEITGITSPSREFAASSPRKVAA